MICPHPPHQFGAWAIRADATGVQTSALVPAGHPYATLMVGDAATVSGPVRTHTVDGYLTTDPDVTIGDTADGPALEHDLELEALVLVNAGATLGAGGAGGTGREGLYVGSFAFVGAGGGGGGGAGSPPGAGGEDGGPGSPSTTGTPGNADTVTPGVGGVSDTTPPNIAEQNDVGESGLPGGAAVSISAASGELGIVNVGVIRGGGGGGSGGWGSRDPGPIYAHLDAGDGGAPGDAGVDALPGTGGAAGKAVEKTGAATYSIVTGGSSPQLEGALD